MGSRLRLKGFGAVTRVEDLGFKVTGSELQVISNP
jgi:hypothetical protein